MLRAGTTSVSSLENGSKDRIQVQAYFPSRLNPYNHSPSGDIDKLEIPCGRKTDSESLIESGAVVLS
jgi:hypothetical protein